MAKERPIGVTILAFLAILGAVNAFIYTLQMLHLLPTFLGPIAFYQFSLIGAFFWGLLFFIWLAVFRMLWEVQPQGWMFMVLIAGFDLIRQLSVLWVGHHGKQWHRSLLSAD